MRLITRATLLTFVYTIITSHLPIAYHDILLEFKRFGIVWGLAFDILWRDYVNQAALILSIILLIATVITGILEDKSDIDFL